jgi:hypothetical protein
MKLKVLVALMIVTSPMLALASSHSASAHMRPQLFHDRSPKPHVHQAKPHRSA